MPNWLYQRSFLTPDRIALEMHDEKITFLELHERAQTLAGKLASLSIQQGDYVAFLLHNSIHTVELIHALTYIGAIIVPLNNRLTPDELHFQLKDSKARLLIYADSFADNAREASHNLEKGTAVAMEDLWSRPQSKFLLREEVSLDDQHTIMYTSGTTGSPKGVILTYGNHWWSAMGSALNLGLNDHDRWLCTVPMFHMSGLSILIRSVIYGMPVLIHESFHPEKVNEAIHNHGVTIISVVSAMLTKLLPSQQSDYPASFRCMLLGGGPAPKPLLESCVNRNIPVYQTYGMTETASQFVTLSSEYMLTKLGSAGKPLFHSQLKIMKTNGQIAPPHEVGEIVVKGENVTKGYLHRDAETAETIQNNWLYTGDLGYLDHEGFLYVVDRRSDLIISGGENVYPAEIEATLLAHHAVAEVGVTGVHDEQWGQIPLAFIVKNEQVNEEQLLAFCREKLATYKQPKRIYFVPALPRNGANKLMRRELIQLVKECD